MKRGIIWISLMVVLEAAVFSTPVEAALVTIEIEGVVDDVVDPDYFLNGRIDIGDVITGSYTYDTSTPNSSPLPLPYGARYEHFAYPSGFSLSVGGLDFMTDPANTSFLLEIINDYPYDDAYIVVSYENLPLAYGPRVNNIAWYLKDYSGTAISTVDLTSAAPLLGDWQGNHLSIGGGPGDRVGFVVVGHVTSAVVVPEPATVFLFSLGGLILGRKAKN